MKKPKLKKIDLKSRIQKLRNRQSKSLNALRNFVNEERRTIDEEVTDPIDYSIYRLRGFHRGIKNRREVGKEQAKTGIRRGVSAARKLIFESMLSTQRSRKRKVVK